MFGIEDIKKDYDEILKQLSDPGLISDYSANNPPTSSKLGRIADVGWEKFEELSNKKKSLEKIIEKQKEIDGLKTQIEENKTILKAKDDQELSVLAESELPILREKIDSMEKELENMLEENSSPQPAAQSVIIEIRAGAGGDEAALFAGELYRMYSKYATLQSWKQKILDSHPTEIGGFKEIIFEIDGDVFAKLKNEGGVHRVQRIPKTEKAGRVHTSTATVAVLPKPKSSEIKIKPDEIKIDFFRSSGAGGQNVNKRETAVRITHLPSGISVASQTERSQAQNKENALAILSAKIVEKRIEEEQSRLDGKRNIQIGGAKRAEKIRTYNFPQDRVTDHRLKKSWHNIEEIMEGKIEKIIESLQ